VTIKNQDQSTKERQGANQYRPPSIKTYKVPKKEPGTTVRTSVSEPTYTHTSTPTKDKNLPKIALKQVSDSWSSTTTKQPSQLIEVAEWAKHGQTRKAKYPKSDTNNVGISGWEVGRGVEWPHES